MLKYVRMKCILPLIFLIFLNAFASAQYYNPNETWNNITKSDDPSGYVTTTVGGRIMRTGGVIYRHTNKGFYVIKDLTRSSGWMTQFNTDLSLQLSGIPSNNVDSFLYQGNSTIDGNGIITFDTVYFNIGAGNKMDIINFREPPDFDHTVESYWGYPPGGITVARRLYFNNGLTATNRDYPVYGAIVFVNDADYINTPGIGLSDAQHVDGFVTEVNYEAHTGAPGHAGSFIFPTGNSTEVYPLQRSGMFTDYYKTLTIGWVDGDPNTVPDPTNAGNTPNPTDASHLEGIVQSVIGVGFWDWQYQNMFDLSGNALPMDDDQTITVSIPNLTALGGTLSAADLRLVGWNANTGKWENLGAGGASGLTKGSTLTGVIPANTTITALAIGSVTMVLPVSFKDFTVKTANCKALLEWKTQMEFNNSHFNVERSQDGRHFTTIARVNGAGNSNITRTYNYTDEAPFSGKSYYRITQVDFDGKNSSTPIRSIEMNCDGALLKVYPNPATNQITIKAGKAVTQVNILSSSGQTVMKYRPSLSQTGGIFTMNIQSIQSGIYIVQIVNKDGTTELIKLLKK